MTADLLRRAAAKIRETAQAAGFADYVRNAVPVYDADILAHIALWSPDVAELVAVLLDKAARRWDGMRATATDAQIEGVLRVEYALARHILGESS